MSNFKIIKDKDFYKLLLSLSLPIMTQNLLSFLINSLDVVMIGALGELELSATAQANQIFFLLNLFCFGTAGGSIAMVSQYWGKQNTEAIRRVMVIVLRIAVSAAAVFTLLAAVFPRHLLSLYSNETPVIEIGAQYLRIIAVSYIFTAFTSVCMVVLRSVETVKIAAYIMVISLLLNASLNYILIFGKLGFPAMGVAGAAIATVITRVVEFVITLTFVFKFEKKIKLKFLSCFEKLDRTLLGDYMRHGLPVLFNELLWAFGISMQAVIIGRISSSMVAAVSIAAVVTQLTTVTLWGICNTAGIFTGKAIGAGDESRALDYGFTFQIISGIAGSAAMALTLMMRDVAVEFYSVPPETKQLAKDILIVSGFQMFFAAFAATNIVGIFRGAGDTKFALFADIVCMWCVSIPFGIYTGWSLGLSPVIVYLFLKIDEPLKVIICLWRFGSRKWLRNVTRAGSEPAPPPS